MTVGLSALAGAAPAVVADGTTDVTVQVATDDGNLAWSAPTRLLIDVRPISPYPVEDARFLRAERIFWTIAGYTSFRI